MKKFLLVCIFLFGIVILASCSLLQADQNQLSKPAPIEKKSKTVQPIATGTNDHAVENNNKLTICIEKNAKSIKDHNINFAKGHLIVAFKDEVLPDKARSIIRSYGLEFFSDDENRLDKKIISNWVRVSVPQNNELKWKCILEEDASIKYTEWDSINSIN